MILRRYTSCLLAVLLCVIAAGCQTLREISSLRRVDFTIDRVDEAQLAGVPLERVRSYDELSAGDVLRLGRAFADNELPFTFTLHLLAENPEDNSVQARLVQMDWTLLLEERETISGTLSEEVVLPPGAPQDVAIPIQLDLRRFFQDNVRDLAELALAISGQGGQPKRVQLRATPTINTALGPIRYPQPITILSRDVGS